MKTAVAYLEILCRNPDNRTNSKANCKWCALPLMQQTLTKYDNGSTAVMDVHEVLFHDTRSFFVSSRSLRVLQKKHVLRTLKRRSQSSICLMFKVTQDLDEIWCSGLIWYWCVLTSYNLYLTFTAFGLLRCYTASVVSYPTFRNNLSVRSLVVKVSSWTALPLNMDRQAIPKRRQPTSNVRCVTSQMRAEAWNVTRHPFSFKPFHHLAVTVRAYLGLR